jgi:hypothetical protein
MKMPNIDSLIDCGGQITVGDMKPVGSVAIANNESGTLAMLRKHPGESFANLLGRLDQAIEYALEHDEIIDEINQR